MDDDDRSGQIAYDIVRQIEVFQSTAGTADSSLFLSEFGRYDVSSPTPGRVLRKHAAVFVEHGSRQTRFNDNTEHIEDAPANVQLT